MSNSLRQEMESPQASTGFSSAVGKPSQTIGSRRLRCGSLTFLEPIIHSEPSGDLDVDSLSLKSPDYQRLVGR
jgi:hypothetical protein